MPILRKLTLIGLSAALVAGCDAGNADQRAREKMNEARVAAASDNETGRKATEDALKAAAGTPGISQASLAQAKSLLGQAHYDTGLEILREAQRKELEASRITMQIAGLAVQLGNSATLVAGYEKQNPQPAQAEIEKKIAEVKGGPDQAKWVGDIGTLSAAEQEVSRLQGEISKRQTEIKTLEGQRVEALESAEKNAKASDAAQGQESVYAFTKASNDRKTAADLETRIDLLKGELLPLGKELDLATGQQQILQNAVAEFQEQSKTLDAGWKEIQSHIQAQKDLIAQIASASPPPTTEPSASVSAAGKSIAAKAAILGQTLQEADKSRDQAILLIGDASHQFQAAFTAANGTTKDLAQLTIDKPAVGSIVKDVSAILTPQVFKMRSVTTERVLAEVNLEKATGISLRIKVRDMLTPLMQQTGQPVPKEIADATLDQQLKAAITESDDHFKLAALDIEGIIGMLAPRDNPIATNTRKAAMISKIFVLNGQEDLALLKGDNASANKLHTEALAAVKDAVESQATFPSLPGDLASALPPPPAPATEPATDDASSADMQAIHATMAAYIDAIEKNDVDAAKSVSQIESGSEDRFTQEFNAFHSVIELTKAMQDRFGKDNAMPFPDLASSMLSTKVTIKGDEGYSAHTPGGPEEKDFVKVDGQWKVYVGPPTDAELQQDAMMMKFAAAAPAITADIQAGKYANIGELFAALQQAAGGATPEAPTTAPAPAPQ